MHDWKEFVKERLGARELPGSAEEEVVAELAAHLEEAYEEACSRGFGAEAAAKLALQEVEDWRVLAEDICRAKTEEDGMNKRTKSLWLPGMVTLLGASIFLMVLQRLGFQPRFVWTGHVPMLFYWPWLASLPVFGALGAYLSQCAQGPVRTRLAAAAAPALVILVTFFLILPWSLAIDGFSAMRFVYFGIGVANWVVIPGLALLVGALPFLRGAKAHQCSV